MVHLLDHVYATAATLVMVILVLCLQFSSHLLLYNSHRNFYVFFSHYRGADKSLARPGRKQARKHVKDERDFNNIGTRAVIIFFFLQGKGPEEILAILTETVACFLPGRAKDLSAPLY